MCYSYVFIAPFFQYCFLFKTVFVHSISTNNIIHRKPTFFENHSMIGPLFLIIQYLQEHNIKFLRLYTMFLLIIVRQDNNVYFFMKLNVLSTKCIKQEQSLCYTLYLHLINFINNIINSNLSKNKQKKGRNIYITQHQERREICTHKKKLLLLLLPLQLLL